MPTEFAHLGGRGARPIDHAAEDIQEQLRGLEVHYLAAQDGDIRFALLTDWVDFKPAETAPQDDALLELAAAGGRAPESIAHRSGAW